VGSVPISYKYSMNLEFQILTPIYYNANDREGNISVLSQQSVTKSWVYETPY